MIDPVTTRLDASRGGAMGVPAARRFRQPSALIPRFASRMFYRHGVFRPLILGRALIVGLDGHARPVSTALNAGVRLPFVIVGLLESDLDPEGAVAVLGQPDELVAVVSRHHIDTVLIVHTGMAAEDRGRILDLAAKVPVELLLIGAPAEGGRPEPGAGLIGGYAVRRIGYPPVSGLSAGLKRAMDIVLAGTLLLSFGPVLLMIAIAVRLDSPGPALFLQRRRGFNRRVFLLRKFRTMTIEAADPDAQTQTSRGDTRRTRVGAFLRRHSLDELPQLLNVLRGEMSIVGPRPHALGTRTEGMLLEDALDIYVARLRVKPGITGWAQVNGSRGELSTMDRLERRVAYDLYYIANWSLLLDLKILAMTVACVFHDGDAY